MCTKVACQNHMRWQTDLKQRTFDFGLQLFRLYPQIARLGPHYAHIALQLFRSGSGIGALLEEGDIGASRRDMGAKHAIALREARESRYWLRLLLATEVLVTELTPLCQESNEFIATLTTSVRKLRARREAGEEQ